MSISKIIGYLFYTPPLPQIRTRTQKPRLEARLTFLCFL